MSGSKRRSAPSIAPAIPASKSGAGSSVDATLSHTDIISFCYSPRIRSVINARGDVSRILGVREVAILRDANLFLRYVDPKDRFTIMTRLEAALQGEAPYRVTYRWIRPDTQETRHLLCRASLTVQNGEPLFEGIIADITDELEETRQKGEGATLTSLLAEHLPISFLIVDRDLRIVSVSRELHSLKFTFGDEGFRSADLRPGHSLLGLFSKKERRSLLQMHIESILEESEESYSTTLPLPDGGTASIELLPLRREVVEGCLIIIEGATHDRAPTGDSVGFRSLASGVLHNLNNALQSIMGEAAIIADRATDPEFVKRSAVRILETASRTGELGRKLLSYDQSVRTSVDINLAAVSALNRVPEITQAGLTLDVAFGSLRLVEAHQDSVIEIIEGALRQFRALTPQCRQLSVKTFEATVTDERYGLRSGAYVKLVLSSGHVAPLRTRATKQSIVKTPERLPPSAERLLIEMGGASLYDAGSPFGITLTLFFPIAYESERHATDKPALEDAPRILLIDDDPLVLETVASILVETGFPCAKAHDLQSALAKAGQNASSLQLVLIDAVMPGDEGAVILRRLKTLFPYLIFIGFSGAAPQYTQRLLDEGAVQIIHKPADPRTLTATIRAVLESRSAA